MNPIKFLKACYRKVDHWYKLCYNAVFFSCEHISRLTSEMQDRPLGLRERVTHWVHMRMCSWCRRYASQLQFLRRQLGHYAEHYPEEADTKMPDEAKSRILKKISDSPKDSL
jgi:hypothetical protein